MDKTSSVFLWSIPLGLICLLIMFVSANIMFPLDALSNTKRASNQRLRREILLSSMLSTILFPMIMWGFWLVVKRMDINTHIYIHRVGHKRYGYSQFPDADHLGKYPSLEQLQQKNIDYVWLRRVELPDERELWRWTDAGIHVRYYGQPPDQDRQQHGQRELCR